MAALIIAFILNLLVGAPAEKQNKDQVTTDTETVDTGAITTMGGTGTWTSVEK